MAGKAGMETRAGTCFTAHDVQIGEGRKAGREPGIRADIAADVIEPDRQKAELVNGVGNVSLTDLGGY